MDNQQFSILYNGHPVAVTALKDDTYMVQITYKPIHIQVKKDKEEKKWVEAETQQETYLSVQLGKLISNYFGSNEL